MKHEILWIAGCFAIFITAKFSGSYFFEAIVLLLFLGYGLFSEFSESRVGIFSRSRFIVPTLVLLLWTLSMIFALDGQVFTQRLIALEMYTVCLIMLMFFSERKPVPKFILSIVLLSGTVCVSAYRLDNFFDAYDFQKRFNANTKEWQEEPEGMILEDDIVIEQAAGGDAPR
ncbi:MAG: hypothetical protein AB3N10_03470 [Allomuricauda sp.]